MIHLSVRSGVLLASFTLFVQGGLSYLSHRKITIPQTPDLQAFPAQVGVWHSEGDSVLGEEVLQVLSPDVYLLRTYTNERNGISASLFLSYFNSFAAERGPHSPAVCLPGAGWQSVSQAETTIRQAGGPDSFPANRFVIEKQTDRNLVLYWYQSREGTMIDGRSSRLHLIGDTVRSGYRDIYMVRIVIAFGDPQQVLGEESAKEFAARIHAWVAAQGFSEGRH
jgi:EpsI family protein